MRIGKDTKKQLGVLVLVIIMFAASAAWIFLGAAPLAQQDLESQLPETPIIEGYLNNETAAQLLAYGFTLMEWHSYPDCCPDLQMWIDALPEELEYQILIQKISDADTPWASARSLLGEEQWNVTSYSDIMPPLCEILLKPPLECGLMQFNITENETE